MIYVFFFTIAKNYLFKNIKLIIIIVLILFSLMPTRGDDIILCMDIKSFRGPICTGPTFLGGRFAEGRIGKRPICPAPVVKYDQNNASFLL